MKITSNDPKYIEAIRLVIETQQVSVSFLQRRLRCGYTQAARYIDLMERAGIVGPYMGSIPRRVLKSKIKS